MILAELLEQSEIKTALIVDDVCDAIPTARDIDPGNSAWPTFMDDLQEDQQKIIVNAFPKSSGMRFDDLVNCDFYIKTIWDLQQQLGDIVEPIFSTYIDDQKSDQEYINILVGKLEDFGLECRSIGRKFSEEAQAVDLIVIDLFFSKTQDTQSLNESKGELKEALARRSTNPPLVILMSRSARLEDKRDEFRDEVGLLDSAFRIIKKSDLAVPGRLERQLERLAKNASDSRKLAAFFCKLERGMEAATKRTLELLRKLRLSDIGQIQQLLLSVEGEPAGSYLVDVFDRILQHEIERDKGIIDAAIELNEFSAANHPPPYVAGSPELQELVARILAQNNERLRLQGALEATVAFGDILSMTEHPDIDALKAALLVDMSPDKVLLVLTPACDLQRSAAPRILLLVGTAKLLDVRDWSYGDDARTPVIIIDGKPHCIKWNLKHIDTVSHDQLNSVFNSNDLRTVARLREGHVLELQQKVLAGLGRVGMLATLPATFSVNVEFYYANVGGIPTRLNVPSLNEGAVCFVGRDNNSKRVLRLVMTDHCCDGVIDAYTELDYQEVNNRSQQAFGHVLASGDFRQMLTIGIELKGAKGDGWFQIPLTGADQGVPKMGLLAWNYDFNMEAPLTRQELSKAGVIILVKDRTDAEDLGYEDAVRNGLV